jgi:molybdopterin-guanine dinucleotide biosynthesis protein A
MPRLAAVILAGGRASRMGGGDKPLLMLGGTPMLTRIIAAVAVETATVALSANGDPGRFARFGRPVLADPPGFARQGPLAGLLAGLDWAAGQGAEALLSVPGDTPFMPPGLAAALAPAPAFSVRARARASSPGRRTAPPASRARRARRAR